MEHLTLSTAKYLEPVLEEERRMIRRARNTKAIQDFISFLIGLVAIYAGVFAVRTIDLWRPYVEHFLSAMGLS